jgi:chaperonin GroEL (HSP60 family)
VHVCVQDSFLDEGFILDKKIGVGQPKRLTDAKVLIANTPMDTDKIKIYGARVRVDSMAKVRWHALLHRMACGSVVQQRSAVQPFRQGALHHHDAAACRAHAGGRD